MKQNLQPVIKWLKDNERSQSWLTDKMGLSRTAFTSWKQGIYKISDKHLQQIEEITGIKPTEIEKEGV